MSQSQSCVVEELEQRRHLSATLLSAYYPLVRGSTLTYDIVDDGERRTDVETISSKMRRLHGQSVFQRIVDSSDGERVFNYENYSANGQYQLHQIGNSSLLIGFNPPIAFPKFAKLGQSTSMEGRAEMRDGSRRLTGKYHAEIRVLGNEPMRVPAGTFSCVKVQAKVEWSFTYHNDSFSYTDTQTDWLGKGVGPVKWIEKTHLVETNNGRRKVEDGVSKSVLKSYSIGSLTSNT